MLEAEPIVTERLVLAVLRPDDADELVRVLADERLHAFTGGRPDSLEELRARYVRLDAGSPRPREAWLNWVVRRRADDAAVGTVQATVSGREQALVAWVIGVPWQRQGFATEAARALAGWLRGRGIGEIRAHIHSNHDASAQVAARAGLQPTADEVDGEQVWRSPG